MVNNDLIYYLNNADIFDGALWGFVIAIISIFYRFGRNYLNSLTLYNRKKDAHTILFVIAFILLMIASSLFPLINVLSSTLVVFYVTYRVSKRFVE